MSETNKQKIPFLVCVRCFTFNHASFIEDAMNGFAMQQTVFPFVCVIVDDASIDGEPEVIDNYLQENFLFENKEDVRKEETDDYVMTFARHKTNHNCYFAVYLLKYNHYSVKKSKFPYFTEFTSQVKYIALCEGDDYWIDSDKLQFQVAFLENNPDYSMCFHNARVKNENTDNGTSMNEKVEDRDYKGYELFENWLVPTCSIIYFKKKLDIETRGNNRILYGDIVLILKCAKVGKVKGISKEMSVYRLHTGSLVHNKVNLNKAKYKKPEHYYFIWDNFGDIIHRKDFNRHISFAYFDLFKAEKCISILAWKSLALSLYYYPTIIWVKINKLVKKIIN